MPAKGPCEVTGLGTESTLALVHSGCEALKLSGAQSLQVVNGRQASYACKGVEGGLGDFYDPSGSYGMCSTWSGRNGVPKVYYLHT